MQSHQLPTPAVIAILCFSVLAGILYLLTLQKALKKCAPASRTMKPGKVWLVLIPIFGLAWGFVVVVNIAKSLRNELARLGEPCPEPTPGQKVGLVAYACVCFVALIPKTPFPFLLLWELVGTVGFFSWIAYWIRIANYSRLLEECQAMTPASPVV